MTSLIRGFDESFKDLFRQIGPNTIFVAKFSFVSFSQGKEFRDLHQAAEHHHRGRARDRALAADRCRGVQLGGGPGTRPERFTYGNNATKRMAVIGATANFAETNSIPLDAGRFFTQAEVDRRRNVVVLGHAPARRSSRPPIRSARRCAIGRTSTR